MKYPVNIQVVGLYISPAHNFFGHHGKPPGENPALDVGDLECVAGRGVFGDRFFDYRPGYEGQITFFSAEVFEEICRELKLDGKSPCATRRNVITRGTDLNALIGKEFEVQGVAFIGTGECRPCYWMDQALAPGAEAALRGRGGLRAQILTNGRLRVDTA